MTDAQRHEVDADMEKFRLRRRALLNELQSMFSQLAYDVGNSTAEHYENRALDIFHELATELELA